MCENLRKQLVLLMCVLLTGTAFAQLALTRTSFSGTYTPITLAGGATASSATGDNAFEDLIPIGFPFNFLGSPYATIGVNTNGIAAFNGINASANNTELYTSAGPNTVLAPWWDDLSVGAGGSILYQTQGAAGSRTFTIQWTNVSSFYTGSSALLNFQIVLREANGAIEFRYDSILTGAFNAASESASIGIKSAVGGNGEYIDAVTGSSFTGNGMLSASITWPAHDFRFLPGAPTPINTGTYTVGLTGDYYNLSEALADLNHRGVAGNGLVTLSLIDSMYDETPAHGSNFFPLLLGPVTGASIAGSIAIQGMAPGTVISSRGAMAGTCVSQNTTSAITTSTEPVLAWVGAQFSSLSNVKLHVSSANVDRGLSVLSSSGTQGVRYCGFQNIGVVLDRSNTNTIGIEQREPVAPSSSMGSNSYILYQNINISNSYSGIFFDGNATFPDSSCTIGTTSSSIYNFIGGNTADDIGNGAVYAAGIRVKNQHGIGIFNCEVQHVSTNGAANCDGIFIEDAQGHCSVYNNKIHDLNNNSAAATQTVCGIRAGVAASGTARIRIFNNVIYGFGSAYNGTSSAVRQLKGIFVQPAGGGAATSEIEVDFNSVLMNPGASLVSTTCFEAGTVSGPVINTRNNIFANTTAAQTAPAAHYCHVSPAVNAVGNTGSVSDHNDLYIASATRGFNGLGNTTNYSTLASWMTAMAQDSNSVLVNPGFTTPADLHASSLGLDGHAMPLSWVSNDFDYQARGSSPDIGADEFSLFIADVGATTLASPMIGDCYSTAEPVEVRITNYGTVPLNFANDTTWIFASVNGSATQTFAFRLSSDSLNGGSPLAPGAILDVPVGTLNMSAAGTYVFNAYTQMRGDTIPSDDTMNAVTVQYHAGGTSASAANVCNSSTVTLTVSGNTSTMIQWQKSPDGISWTNATGPGNTSASYTTAIYDTTVFRVLMCGGLASSAVTVNELPLPVAAFTDSISGGVVFFNNYSDYANSYLWDFGDNQTSTQQNPSHTYGISNTTYTVVLTASNGCGTDTASVQVPVPTGIAAALVFGTNIYPNPAKDQLNIEFGEAAEHVILELFDAQGKLVQSLSPGNLTAGSVFRMNTKDFENGIYLLRISSGNKTGNARIIISN